MIIYLWPLATALLNRIRGGLFEDKIRSLVPFWATTIARLSITGLMLLPYWKDGLTWRCTAGWLSLYAGYIFGWKAWQAVSNVPHDIWCLSLRGALLTAPVGLFLGNIPLALSGLSMGPLYFIGHYLPKWKELDGTENLHNVTWGEWLFGFVLGLSLILGM